MGKWLALLRQQSQTRPEPSLTEPTKDSFVTFVSGQSGPIPEIKDPIPSYRLVNTWDDLSRDEQRLFEFLQGQGLLYSYQIAAGMSLSVEAVEALLAALDEQRFLLWWGKQVGLNVYAKQWHTQHLK